MRERIIGSLKGIACGDAIGKQTEGLSRAGVLRWYPNGIRGFEGSPGTVIPRYVTNSKREWRIGETTDDTERTIAVARAILQDGHVHHTRVGREMLACTKSVHPGVKSLWEFHEKADPARVTLDHDGCGAAIRVAPVGMLYRSAHSTTSSPARGRLPFQPTEAHSLAAAAASAAAVSAAIDGAGPVEIIELARNAATQAECQRSGAKESVFAQAMSIIHVDLRARRRLDADEVAASHFPVTPLTIVPLALSLAVVMQSIDEALLLAANVGGDSDSVASVAGSILGARFPNTVNDEWYGIVESINSHGLVAIGERLSRLRH